MLRQRREPFAGTRRHPARPGARAPPAGHDPWQAAARRRRSSAGAWWARPSRWPSSAGASASTARPSILQAVREARGWPVSLVSAAVTVPFPGRCGRRRQPAAALPAVRRARGHQGRRRGAGLRHHRLGAGATAPWQLFAATLFSGAGWAPWAPRRSTPSSRPGSCAPARRRWPRPTTAASVGGVVFSPLWVAADRRARAFRARPRGRRRHGRDRLGAGRPLFSRTPQQMGLTPDGDARRAPPRRRHGAAGAAAARALLWRDRRFLTLAAGMALGLFAQIGLIAHLFSLLVPALGAQRAGLAMGLAHGLAIAGRTLRRLADAGRRRPAAGRLRQLRRADRRLAGAAARRRHQRAAAAARRRAVRRRASATPPRCRR